MQLPISILPGDTRMEYTAEAMAKKGGSICSSWSEIPASGYLICGIPFTKDGKMVNTTMPDSISIRSFLGMLTSSHIIIGGNLPKGVISYCTYHGMKYYDVMSSASFVVQNARLTAEGLLIPLLSKTSFSICDCRVLLTGYGNCGREIADILQLFTNEIYIYDTDPSAVKTARSNHFKTVCEKELRDRNHRIHQVNTIINTSPVNPFHNQIWESFPDRCMIFNIGSFSLKLPFPLSDRVIDCPGIPGKYAPKTAGNIIAKQICSHFKL